MVWYILRLKNTLAIVCRAGTLEGLEKNINSCYETKRGMQPKESVYTGEMYMKDKVISKMTLEDLE
jgi:hypothetical protein